jgi:hypothetical protein
MASLQLALQKYVNDEAKIIKKRYTFKECGTSICGILGCWK